MTEEEDNNYQLITNLSLERGKLLRYSTKIECPTEEDELDKLRQENEELRDLVSSLSSVNGSVLSSKQKKKLSSLGLLSEQNNLPLKNIPQVNESYLNQIQQPLFEGTLVNHFKNKSSISDSYPFFESTIYADGLRNIPNVETKYWKLYPFGLTGNITELAATVKAKLYPPVGDYYWITFVKKDNYYTPISDTDDLLLRGATTPWRIKIRARFTIDSQAETPQIDNYTGYSILQVAQEIVEESEITEDKPTNTPTPVQEITPDIPTSNINSEPLLPLTDSPEEEIRVEVMEDTPIETNNKSISEEELDICDIPPESAPPVYEENEQTATSVDPVISAESTNSEEPANSDIDPVVSAESTNSEDNSVESVDTTDSNNQADVTLATLPVTEPTNQVPENENNLLELEALVGSSELVPEIEPISEIIDEITETPLSDDNDPREPECHSDSEIVTPLEYDDNDNIDVGQNNNRDTEEASYPPDHSDTEIQLSKSV